MSSRPDEQTERVVADAVAAQLDRDEAVLVGRATTGLYLLFEALDVDGSVVFPAYTCPSPVYAAQYAGATPQFCDVREDDYNLTADSVASALTPDTEAVVGINMFGHPVEWDEIADVCADHGVTFVEDACQSVGSTYNGRAAGGFSEVSFLSFGNKKPLDAGGGGAVLADDPALVERIRRRERELPVHDESRLEELYDHYRELYYSIDDLRAVTDRAERLFGALPAAFRDLYVRGLRAEQVGSISAALDTHEETIDRRRSHASRYRSALDDPRIDHPEPLGEPVYYRYSLTLPSAPARDHVVTVLREQDIHVSTLYDPIHRRFGDGGSYPTAADLSARTINLWVDDTQDAASIERTAAAITDALDEQPG